MTGCTALQIVALELHLRVVDERVSNDRKLATTYLLHCLLPSGMMAETDNGVPGKLSCIRASTSKCRCGDADEMLCRRAEPAAAHFGLRGRGPGPGAPGQQPREHGRGGRLQGV
jgi:hypothetical protein